MSEAMQVWSGLGPEVCPNLKVEIVAYNPLIRKSTLLDPKKNSYSLCSFRIDGL